MADHFERVGADLVVRDFSKAGVSTFQKNMRLIEREVLGIRRTLSTAFGLTAGYLGFRGLVEGYKSVVKAASDAVESDNLFRTSMGQNAEAVERWSKELGAALGLNETSVRRNVAVFKDMTEGMGLAEEDAIRLSKALTQLSYDLASRRNLSFEESFQKLQAGISGEVEPLKRLGIVLKEQQIEEYALRQGWIQHGQQLSEVGKVYARVGLIMQLTAKDQGDLARTGSEAANMQRRLQAQMQTVREELGQALLPSYQRAMQGISGYLQTNLDDVKSWAEGTIGLMNAAIQAYGRLQRGFADVYEKTVGRSIVEQAAQERYRVLTGDTGAFQQTLVGQGWGGHWETTAPQDMQRYRQILQQLRNEQQAVNDDREAARLERVKLSGTYADVALPEGPAYPDVKPEDLTALVQGQQQDFTDVTRAAKDYRTELQEVKRVQFVNDAMADLSRSLTDIAFDFRNAEEYATQFFETLARNLTEQYIMGPLTAQIGAGLNSLWQPRANTVPMGATDISYGVPGTAVAHRGGRVGYDSFPLRSVSPSVFAGAVRMHAGGYLGPGEVPIIAKKGETILPAGARVGGPQKVEVRISNPPGTPMEAETAGVQFDGEKMVLGIVMKNIQQGGMLRDQIRLTSRGG